MKAKWKNFSGSRLAPSPRAKKRLLLLNRNIAIGLLVVPGLFGPMTVARAQEGITPAAAIVLAATSVVSNAPRAATPVLAPNAPVPPVATTVRAETNRAESVANAAIPSAVPVTPVAAVPPVDPSPLAAPDRARIIAQATPTPSAPAPTEPKAPAITAPAQASPAVSAPPAPEGRPVRVGKLSPEELKARQDAEDRARAAQAKGPAPVASSADRDADTNPQTPVDYLKDNEWQKHAEIRSGNVTILRRSTDEPPAPNETVILRWRTPTEFSRNTFMSSKGHTPNVPGK